MVNPVWMEFANGEPCMNGWRLLMVSSYMDGGCHWRAPLLMEFANGELLYGWRLLMMCHCMDGGC